MNSEGSSFDARTPHLVPIPSLLVGMQCSQSPQASSCGCMDAVVDFGMERSLGRRMHIEVDLFGHENVQSSVVTLVLLLASALKGRSNIGRSGWHYQQDCRRRHRHWQHGYWARHGCEPDTDTGVSVFGVVRKTTTGTAESNTGRRVGNSIAFLA